MTVGGSPRKRSVAITEGDTTPLEVVLATDSRDQWTALAARESARLRARLGLREEPLLISEGATPTLTVQGLVGTVTVGDVSLSVAPKFSDTPGEPWPQDVLTMLGRAQFGRYAWTASGIRAQPVDFHGHLAQAFADRTEAALRTDPIQVYRTFEERSPVLRGRLNLARQLAGFHSRPHLLECDVDRLDTDNHFNQLLHWATMRLLATVSDASLVRRLNWIASQLPPTSSPQARPRPLVSLPPPQYRAWRGPLAIANTLAANLGHVATEQLIDGVSLAVASERLFERFVERSLSVAAADSAFSNLYMRPQHRALYAHPRHQDGKAFQTIPDDVMTVDGQPVAVADAKYRLLLPTNGEPRGRPAADDLYQLVAALTAHGCRHGVLFYPASGTKAPHAEPPRWEVHSFGTTLTIDCVEIECRGIADSSRLQAVDSDLRAVVNRLVSAGVAA